MSYDITLRRDVPQAVTQARCLMRAPAPSYRPLVTDCVFIKANPMAEDLLGTTLPGRGWSEFRSKRMTEQCQRRHVKALKDPGTTINDESLQCFERGGRGGEVVWFRKVVETRHDPKGTIWITTYEVLSQPGCLTEFSLDELDLTQEEIEEECGTHTIFSIQGLTRLTHLDTILPQKVWLDKRQDCPGVSLHWKSDVGRERVRHLYVCQVCGHPWFSKRGVPNACANRETCGTETWRREGRTDGQA